MQTLILFYCFLILLNVPFTNSSLQKNDCVKEVNIDDMSDYKDYVTKDHLILEKVITEEGTFWNSEVKVGFKVFGYYRTKRKKDEDRKQDVIYTYLIIQPLNDKYLITNFKGAKVKLDNNELINLPMTVLPNLSFLSNPIQEKIEGIYFRDYNTITIPVSYKDELQNRKLLEHHKIVKMRFSLLNDTEIDFDLNNTQQNILFNMIDCVNKRFSE